MDLSATVQQPPTRAGTPPVMQAPAVQVSTTSPPSSVGNRPLHGPPTPDPVRSCAASAGAAGDLAEARDARFIDLICATEMQPMVAAVQKAMPSEQARLVAFGHWVIRHAEGLGCPALARQTPNSAARELMAQLPETGHPANLAATAYISVLFNTIHPDPGGSDMHAVFFLGSALSRAAQQPAQNTGAPR